jgi:eukaryotic-like serine/threonine-protein kinase
MIGKTILHYKMIEKLGEGGMGVVYKAEDTKLRRGIAIKFLPHYISVNEDLKNRFEIEARAAASINHPNAATIHAIEEVEDEMFVVMEYVEGKDLNDFLNTNKPLPFKDIINYAA